MEYIMAVAPLLLGWILDRILGDPSWLPHPVVGFGKIISFFEHLLNIGKDRKVKGAVMANIPCAVCVYDMPGYSVAIVSIPDSQDYRGNYRCFLLPCGHNAFA